MFVDPLPQAAASIEQPIGITSISARNSILEVSEKILYSHQKYSAGVKITGREGKVPTVLGYIKEQTDLRQRMHDIHDCRQANYQNSRRVFVATGPDTRTRDDPSDECAGN
jgi:hypothetical protein